MSISYFNISSFTRNALYLALITLFLISLPVSAQWSDDPANNLVISDRSGQQAQPKVAPTEDGGAYVSWFDNSAGGFDVYLQRLNAAGVEQWAHNGILVADRGFTSTQDYGLSVDTAGNALLAYRDDQGAFTQVSVAKVNPAGNVLWDVQLNAVPDFVAAPAVVGTTDGNSVVAWSQDVNTMAQKLDPDGVALWGGGVTMTPGGTSLLFSDIQAGDAGTAIVLMVDTVAGARQLWAQKLASADGAGLWGGSQIPIYDAAGGSLQFGNFPNFVSDGSGGAVFSWYTNAPSLQCRTQRVNSTGTELFAHNGVETSTNATRVRAEPSGSFNSVTGETFVFWVEANGAQSQWGIYGQKLDIAGVRQWGNEGQVLVALGGSAKSFVQNSVFGDGAMVTWIDSLAFENDPIRSTRVDTDGDFVWSPNLTTIATNATGTSRLTGALSTSGFGIYSWSDGSTSSADILIQNLNGDGSLGGILNFSQGFESEN